MPDSFERAFKYIIKYVIVAHYFLDSYVAIKDISPEVMTPDQADLTALAVKWEVKEITPLSSHLILPTNPYLKSPHSNYSLVLCK